VTPDADTIPERTSDMLNRAAAGMRAASAAKLLFIAPEAAVVLGVSTATLEKWRKEGRGPEFVLLSESGNRGVRYHRDALVEYAGRLRAEAEAVRLEAVA
jgi:hypothetical protein